MSFIVSQNWDYDNAQVFDPNTDGYLRLGPNLENHVPFPKENSQGGVLLHFLVEVNPWSDINYYDSNLYGTNKLTPTLVDYYTPRGSSTVVKRHEPLKELNSTTGFLSGIFEYDLLWELPKHYLATHEYQLRLRFSNRHVRAATPRDNVEGSEVPISVIVRTKLHGLYHL